MKRLYLFLFLISFPAFAAQYTLLGGGSGGGVTSLNSLTGALSLLPGTGISITPSGSGITITNTGGGGSSPLTTKGDLYTFSTVNTRLPVGIDGYVLAADSTQITGLNWIPIGFLATSITTTTNTPTTVYSFPVGSGDAYYLIGSCVAEQGGTNRAAFERRINVFNTGSGATIQGFVQNSFSESSDLNWNLNWIVSGGNAVLQATGDVAQTVVWTCSIRAGNDIPVPPSPPAPPAYARNTLTITSPTVIATLTTDYIVNVNSSSNIAETLPDAVGSDGWCIDMKEISTGSVTISPPGGQTIDGIASDSISNPNETHKYCAVSGNWWIY